MNVERKSEKNNTHAHTHTHTHKTCEWLLVNLFCLGQAYYNVTQFFFLDKDKTGLYREYDVKL